MPLPPERKETKDVEVVADERLAVEHDREEVHREVSLGDRRPTGTLARAVELSVRAVQVVISISVSAT